MDYQLRELCKLNFELDIRTRLGKLPKNLSGVYDEIMSSIEARPGTDFEFATRALKWVLVAQRPLKPQELVAATEINPSSTSPDRPADQSLPPLQPTLDIDLVVDVCGGLILLDQKLEVVRFAHLSVHEYLETRKDTWGVIDAQRFVSEGCLWTLQCGPSLVPALYKYAGENWFLHCRSYQDIALSLSSQDPNHTLDIPILNTFLGSFGCPSIHFVEWAKHNLSFEHRSSILSIPLRPAFAAAVFGLGELVSWLWHSEGADMNIKNDHNHSLLYLASRDGTTWTVACILARGVDLDINEVGSKVTALWGAAYSGVLEKAALLLGNGADINLAFRGYCGTALEKAAAEGQLEMATFLLDRGAEINLTSSSYFGTAVGAAAGRGQLEMAKLLLDRGANRDLANCRGQRPRNLAEERWNDNTIRLLDSYKTENQTNDTQLPVDGSQGE